MCVLFIPEQQAAAVRVHGRQVDLILPQQGEQDIRPHMAEVTGHDAVEIGRLRTKVRTKA